MSCRAASRFRSRSRSGTGPVGPFPIGSNKDVGCGGQPITGPLSGPPSAFLPLKLRTRCRRQRRLAASMRRVRSGYCHCARATEATITAALQVLVAAALGVASGVLGGLFGVGGGFLVIPLLGIVYGVHQQMAQGTALVMVVPNVLFAFWRYRQQFGVDLRMAITIAAAALV